MIKEIFPTKIWHAPVKNFEAIQEEISRAVDAAEWDYYQEKENWGRSQKFAVSKPFSHDIIDQYDMLTFQQEILAAVQEYRPDYEFGVHTRPKSWITKYDVGDYSHIHKHTPATISGAYYYDIGDDNNFFFEENSVMWAPSVKTGDLILFPSSLRHGVRKIENGSRIVLSFNMFF
jgi:hypothetical protein